MRTWWGVCAVMLLPSLAWAERSKLAIIPAQIEDTARGVVPKLFDDYLLTAVHALGSFEVIGQDDINALLGFEKQKQLFGCDDVACMADIGGALGVERLLNVKIARLKEDWAITLKLINIKLVKVDARSSEFVRGDAKALLEAMPDVVRRLFAGGAALQAGGQPPPPLASVVASRPVATAGLVPEGNPALGRGERAKGTALVVVGLAAAGLGSLLAMTKGTTMGPEGKEVWRVNGYVGVNIGGECRELTTTEWDSRGPQGISYSTEASECEVADMGMLTLAAAIYGAGLVTTGLGAGKYIDGKGQAVTGDASALGHYPYTWMGYVLAAVGMAAPLLGGAMQSDALAWGGGLGGVLGSATVFALSMGSDSTYFSSGSAGAPAASLTPMTSGGRVRPFVTLAIPL